MEQRAENQPNFSEASPIKEAIMDAELLLAHASSHGISIDPDLVKNVVAAKQLLSANLEDPSTFDAQSTFWNARNQLSKAVHPVTSASLKASAQTGPLHLYRSLAGFFSRKAQTTQAVSPAERSALWFRFLATLALFLLLAVQVYWVVGSRVIQETAQILEQVKTNTDALAKLSADDPQAQELEAQKMSFDEAITIRYGILERWNAAWKFPFQILGIMNKTAPVENPGYNDLERIRLISGFASQSIELYLLPLLYGWLGACLYVLRMLAQDIKTLSYTPEQNMIYRLRLYMGTLAGLIVVWFLPVAQTDPDVKSLSIFAVALLAGYSVDLLFALMDRIIAAFTTAR